MGKKPAGKPKKDQTLELRLPNEIYDKYADLDAEALQVILESVLGGKKIFGITKVVISPKSQTLGAATQSFMKLCGH